jgi:phosphoserine/homoserine phosphotransferase
LLCHRLVVEEGQIVRFVPRVQDAKRRAVSSYQELGYHVTAVGDSHNDISMLQQAEAGCLFRSTPGLPGKYPNLLSLEAYDELTEWIDRSAGN